MKTRLATARLETLKMQLHPHFLFNTLNSILPLVFRDRDAASRTVVRLADLLRLSLQNEASDLIPLRKEIEVLQVYLEIQQTRFQDRLTVELDVEPEVERRARPEPDPPAAGRERDQARHRGRARRRARRGPRAARLRARLSPPRPGRRAGPFRRRPARGERSRGRRAAQHAGPAGAALSARTTTSRSRVARAGLRGRR